MRKRVIKILAAILTVCAVMFAGLSYFLGSQVVAASTQLVTNEETTGVSDTFWQKYGIDYQNFRRKYTIEKISLTSSFDGHTIPGEFIYCDEKSKATVIMVHGLGGNRYSNYPVAELFLENGYNVITYDQRSTNENTAEKTTFGYWEKYDLIDCINFAEQQAGGNHIGIWGTSFGGATAVQAAAYENTQEHLAFLILDCPVSSMEWMIQEEIRKMELGIPVSYMTWCGSTVNHIQLGFSYKDADSTEAAKNIQIPTLIINSEKDEITPYFMGRNLYDNLSSNDKELWTVPDSAHTEMWLDYNDEYRSRVTEFCRRQTGISGESFSENRKGKLAANLYLLLPS